MDETGISTVLNRTAQYSPQFLVQKEVKQSLLYCMSATGVFVPPALILPRKRINPLLYKDAPNGTLPLISDTGYMDSHLFIDWLKHFVKHAKPSAEDPVLFIVHNHTSHFSLPSVLFCRDYHITCLTLPPHANHVLQPLDKCLFASLKALYSSEA
ncbi:hypothetical protein AVEN_253302-1 [Araneus ventricosus]|uniref:DDE-1 domain-containing protein n=1 Tax=Araneus ventricosus TaxID=182803 RepID=A0A4Y2LR43_ARAVE|nr:hypothetical protein AVEN_253302-1 [Araneus ventricosus]